jgi:hypothetical protein
MEHPHFLSNKPNKPIFCKNLDVFFSMFPYTHVGNTLFVDDTPYNNMFNDMYSAIVLESFDNIHGEDRYLLRFVIPYMENLHLSKYGVPIFVEHNPFGRIKFINLDNL